MPDVQILSFPVPNWNHGGTTAKLRLYSSENWTDFDGVPHLGGITGSPEDFYQNIPCDVAGTNLTVPDFLTPATVISPDHPTVRITGVLVDEWDTVIEPPLFSHWFIPDVGILSWVDLSAANSAPMPPLGDGFVRMSTLLALLNQFGSAARNASAVVVGITSLDVNPLDPNIPKAVSVNSPLLLPASSVIVGRTALDVDPDNPALPRAVAVNSPLLNPNESVRVKTYGASGAKTSADINIGASVTTAAVNAGATSIPLSDASTFAVNDVLKVTGAGPGGGVYRGLVVNKAANTLTVYPATHTAVAAGATVLHGDANVVTRTMAAVAAGGTVVPVVSPATFAVGQGIYIAGAGAAAGGGFAPFIGSIQSISGNNITLVSGIATAITANALVMHDDSAAFNAAVAAAVALRSAVITIPAGVYMLNGPPSGTNQGRIQLPAVTSISRPVTIRFQGSPCAIPTFPAFIANHGISSDGSILQSDGAGGAIIAGDDGANGFTLIEAQFFDLSIRSYDDPHIRGLDGRLIINLLIERCKFDTGSQSGLATLPTDVNNFAFATGQTSNGGTQVVRNVWSMGAWYSGMDLAEHAVVEGNVTSLGNYYGFRLQSALHPIFINRICVHECTRSYAVLSPLRYKIGMLVLERRWPTAPFPAWANTEWDVYDPNSYGSGEVAYTTFIGAVNSYASSFLVNGARDLNYYPVATGNVTNFGIPFADDFDDNSTETMWWSIGSILGNPSGDPHGSVVEQNNHLEITPVPNTGGSKYRGYVTKDTYNLFGKAVAVRVPQVTTNGADTIVTLQTVHDPTTRYQIVASAGNIYFALVYRGAASNLGTLPYDPVNHLWWRIRELSNYRIRCELSADGVSWPITLGLDDSIHMLMNQIRISLEAGTGAGIAVPGMAIFENFSIT